MKVLMPVQTIFIPLVAAAALLLLLTALFSGCYTLTQGITMLGYLGRAIPLEELARREAPAGDAGESPAEEADRVFVERVMDIRRFAMEGLGLRESKNYTRYVELDRDYLAAVVSAADKTSFTRHEWWFPVVGRVPYKGFFNPRDARKERAKLERRDLDVWVRGVDAFSTLGWFRDPLYSYMKKYPVYELADLIIHELLHATVYLKGESQFNEELAEFVGGEGARLYMESRFGTDSAEYRRMLDAKTDGAAYAAFIRGLIAELDALYRSGAAREEKLRQKEEIIRAAQRRFAAEYDALFQGENYRGFEKLPVNNAYLELYRLYYAEDDYLAGFYRRSGGDLPRFIAAARTLRGKDAPRQELERALGLGRE
jgi:predicted aminopeptidase